VVKPHAEVYAENMIRRGRDIVLIGGSAGGIRAIRAILRELPSDFPGSVLVVLHRPGGPAHPDALAEIFSSRTALPIHSARDEQPVEPGHVYLAPADHHMLLLDGLIRLERGPRENRFRPCMDVLFKSAAMSHGRRVIGVLLTGALGGDGVAGLWQIKQRGGITIVQDPADAEFPAAPQAAIDSVVVHYVLPLAQITPKLIEMVSAPARGDAATRPRLLIVEDESVVATNLQQSLTAMGYEVLDWVPTGEAALELAERERPDLILMDIRLAGALTGIASARRIWESLQIPIVYCTAHADLETLKSVQTTESYGYVVKPFQSPAVRAAVELALGRRDRELR
jgi:chemotaxis response regulator CheB